jgi:hypothetical protein
MIVCRAAAGTRDKQTRRKNAPSISVFLALFFLRLHPAFSFPFFFFLASISK